MKISIIISTQDYECELLFILQELEWYDGSITICQAVSFHKRIVIMVDHSQQFSISILSFTFLSSGTILFLFSIYFQLFHNLCIGSLRLCMQFLISLLTFEQSHCFLPSLWDTEQYQHLMNYCPPIFSESSFLKHNQAFDNN